MPVTKIIATAQAENNGEIYATTMQVHQHSLIADELHEHGGQDLGPDPTGYLCMSLASCTVITLRMYVQRKGWTVEKISTKVDLVKEDAAENTKNTFHCEVSVTGALTAEQHERLLHIAKACPVHRLLTKPSDVITILK